MFLGDILNLVTKDEIRWYAWFGAAYYLGKYFFLCFLDWLPSLLYKFGFVYYQFSTWANKLMGYWIHMPAIEIINTGQAQIHMFVNMLFWALMWVIYMFIWNNLHVWMLKRHWLD